MEERPLGARNRAQEEVDEWEWHDFVFWVYLGLVEEEE